jgi:ATP-dependent Clp protease adapter protein ClpS
MEKSIKLEYNLHQRTFHGEPSEIAINRIGWVTIAEVEDDGTPMEFVDYMYQRYFPLPSSETVRDEWKKFCEKHHKKAS